MKVGSIFSGIEGMGLGLLDAFEDAELVWHAEVDPAASSVLARHFDAPNLGDVTKIDWSTVEPVDLLIGGPPCQAISSAGLRRGIADERWMWPEAFRAMAELTPAWCLWENPVGLLNGRQKDGDDAEDEDDDAVEPGDGEVGPSDGNLGGPATDPSWFGHVLGEMVKVGYVGRWGCIRSSDVGAPHRRERLFIAATNTSSTGWEGRRPADENWGVVASIRGSGPPPRDLTELLPTPRVTGERTLRRDGSVYHADGYERESLDDATHPRRWAKYADAVARWAAIFGEIPPGPRDVKGRHHRDLPRWMMGFPAGWVDGLSRHAAIRCLGNGCQPQVATAAARLLLPASLVAPG